VAAVVAVAPLIAKITGLRAGAKALEQACQSALCLGAERIFHGAHPSG
jgi:hypothetical protein